MSKGGILGVSKKKRARKYAGFTLVELIVVITILVILGAIAFVQLGWFASSARDSRRVSDMSNITQAIELAIVTQWNAPSPSGAVPYTGGLVTIKMGTVTSATVQMSGDFTDPTTHIPYNYSVFGNGSYYQIGMDFENPLSYNIGIPWIDKAYADTVVKYSKLSGNYTFDPSLPSLFFLTGTVNSASGGIFSPDVCFILNNVSTNTFSSTSTGCITKKNMALKNLDGSLIGYWDMETLFNSWGIDYLKDLSWNWNNGTSTWTSSFPTQVGWSIGNWMQFSWAILIWSDLDIQFDGRFTLMSISSAYSFQNPYPRIFSNRHFSSAYMNCKLFESDITYSWSCIGPNLNYQWVNTFWWQITSSTWGTLDYHYSTNLLWITGTWIAKKFEDRRINNTISLNRYYHTTLVFDTDIIKIYVNGNKVDETKAEGFNFVKNSANTTSKYIYIWWVSWANKTRDFDWVIDEVKFYKRALSDSEIKQFARVAGF